MSLASKSHSYLRGSNRLKSHTVRRLSKGCRVMATMGSNEGRRQSPPT